MKIAFIILYLTYGSSGTVEVPQHFSSIEECQQTFEAISIKTSARQAWSKADSTIPMGSCVTILLK